MLPLSTEAVNAKLHYRYRATVYHIAVTQTAAADEGMPVKTGMTEKAMTPVAAGMTADAGTPVTAR